MRMKANQTHQSKAWPLSTMCGAATASSDRSRCFFFFSPSHWTAKDTADRTSIGVSRCDCGWFGLQGCVIEVCVYFWCGRCRDSGLSRVKPGKVDSSLVEVI